MSRLAMFLYPWDVLHEGSDAVVAELARRGVDRLAVAAAYHSAEVISPRRGMGVMSPVEANCAYLPLGEAAFSGIRLREGELAARHPDLFGDLARAASESGIAMTGWVIVLHNSALAAAHPEAALVNCFGDRSSHGLCPANPAVRAFATELLAAVAATGHFDTLLLESLSYLLAGHGHPHQLWAVRLDPRCRLLLSLCFCGHCTEAAAQKGIDVAALRGRCAKRLGDAWNSELAPQRTQDEGLELAAMVVEDEELGAFARARCKTVNDLVRSVATNLADRDIRLSLTTAVWGRPSPANWLEGIDLAESGRVADEICLTTYATDLADVARDIDFSLELVPTSKLTVVNTMWPEHHRSVEELTAKVALARAAGVRSFGLYSYGTALGSCLPWVDRVAEVISS